MAVALEQHLKSVIDCSRIDRVTCRVKSVEKFVAKAIKCDKDGHPKYSIPLIQIQDQIGARIIVFYKQDVRTVETLVNEYFRPIESQEKEPVGLEFGYESLHYILRYPKEELVYNEASGIDFFELQIKTLFQHAWAEAEHDMRYKTTVDLTKDQRRLFAFAASQAWGADKVFENLFDEIYTNQSSNALEEEKQDTRQICTQGVSDDQ
jgi:ppGpp synthetase/RelA/SpoT-type nucleotidyltranferase